MTKRYKLKGLNSDSETCEVCGRTGLKRVMWLDELDSEGNETGHVRAFGTTCGAKALGFGGRGSSKATIERQITDLSYKLVKDEIERIRRSELVLHKASRIFLTKDCIYLVLKNEMPLTKAVEARNNAYPILDYHAGKITIEDALQLV